MPKKKRFENLLPNDADLIERSIIWGTLYEKYAKQEEVEGLPFSFGNKDENQYNTSDESIDPLEFETNYENDSNFDVQDTLNKTKKYIEKRVQKWQNTGLDQIMDSFNLNEIQSKVGNWLCNENNLFCNNLPNSTAPLHISYINEVKIKNHEIYSDNDSVDTAKYILSSRRKRSKSKITTMTIKRYRYSNGKGLNESRKNLKSDEKFLKYYPKENYSENSVNESRLSNNITKQSRNNPRSVRYYRRSKSTDTSKSSSLIREIPEIGCKLFPEYDINFRRNKILSPKTHQKISRKSSKWRNTLHAKENNKSSSSSVTSTPSPRKKNLRKQFKKLKIKNNKVHGIESNASVESDIHFHKNNVINSTAIDESVKNAENPSKISIVSEEPELVQENVKSNHKENNVKKKNYNPIVLYEPDNSILSSGISMEKIILTKKLLMDKIGEDLAEKFLNGEKELAHEFDSTSKILFYPPEIESGNSSNSESDFLEKAFKRTSRIVEVVNLNS